MQSYAEANHDEGSERIMTIVTVESRAAAEAVVGRRNARRFG